MEFFLKAKSARFFALLLGVISTYIFSGGVVWAESLDDNLAKGKTKIAAGYPIKPPVSPSLAGPVVKPAGSDPLGSPPSPALPTLTTPDIDATNNQLPLKNIQPQQSELDNVKKIFPIQLEKKQLFSTMFL